MRTKPHAGEPAIVRCPPTKVIAIAGEGSPDGPAFEAAIQALYGIAYTIKFARKKRGLEAFKVAPLEGLWDKIDQRRAQWTWKLQIPMPHDVAASEVAAACAAKSITLPVALESFREGTVVEALHVGPYASEPETIASMRAFMASHGLRARGRHHEIYLGDPRRTDPARLQTILRQPVAPAT